jgi:hypothetical protein
MRYPRRNSHDFVSHRFVCASLEFETLSFETTTKPMVSVFLRFRIPLKNQCNSWKFLSSSRIVFPRENGRWTGFCTISHLPIFLLDLLMLCIGQCWNLFTAITKVSKDREWSFRENQHFEQTLSIFQGMNASIS